MTRPTVVFSTNLLVIYLSIANSAAASHYPQRSSYNVWPTMNQNFSSTQGLVSQQGLPASAQHDAWAVLLDSLLVIFQHWKLVVTGPLIAGMVAYGSSWLLPKSYLSYAYVGALDEGVAKRSSSLIFSPVVLDAAVRKLAQPPFSALTPEQGRSYLAQRLAFSPVKGADPKLASIYVLQVLDSEPSHARDMLTAVIASWLAAMKPRPERLASLQRQREALELQSSDLSLAISQLMNHPELLRPDIKTGYAPINVADMIKLRTDGVNRIEELRASIEGLSPDIVILAPTMPKDPVGPAKLRIALIAAAVTFVGLAAILLVRGVLTPAILRSAYGPGIRNLGDALRGRRMPPGSTAV